MSSKGLCNLKQLKHTNANLTKKPVEQIRGKILDENGKPLPGASIKELGALKNVALSNAEGEFVINVASTESSIIVSYIGFVEQTIKVGDKKNIIVNLKPNVSTLGEAVIIGYQTQSKRKTTSAVQVIEGRSIENLPAPSLRLYYRDELLV
jgi:hypothetical protein